MQVFLRKSLIWTIIFGLVVSLASWNYSYGTSTFKSDKKIELKKNLPSQKIQKKEKKGISGFFGKVKKFLKKLLDTAVNALIVLGAVLLLLIILVALIEGGPGSALATVLNILIIVVVILLIIFLLKYFGVI